ncbi:MAG: OmpA family protein, partial [Anaerolineales bacterium]|nr:OmpA family protein [Anaerolineales bacterium]
MWQVGRHAQVAALVAAAQAQSVFAGEAGQAHAPGKLLAAGTWSYDFSQQNVKIIGNSSKVFPSGSNDLTPEGKRILGGIAETLLKNGDKIAVEGHTDAKGFASGQ